MKITIHQPEHMPWLGFFHKINMADTYVVLDNVQYRRRYFQNRNKIRTRDGWQWLTVPLQKESRDGLFIKDAKIFNDDNEWRANNTDTIYQNYNKAPCFKQCWGELKDVYGSGYHLLEEMNLALIKFFMKKLNIKSTIVLASDLDVCGSKGELILSICKNLNAKTYVSGISGRDYLDLGMFADNGINVIVQEFHHPIYKQMHEPFLPCMSVLDLVFNHGDKSLDVINGSGFPVMKEVFL